MWSQAATVGDSQSDRLRHFPVSEMKTAISRI